VSILVRGGLVLRSARARAEPLDVLLEGKRIAALAPSIVAPPDARVIDATGHLVVPGFVNAHTHGRENLIKGLVDNRPLELWLHQLAALSDERTPRDQYVCAALGALEMMKNGVTSTYDMFTNIPVMTPEAIDAVLRAYRDVGLRALMAPCVADIPYHHSIPGFVECLPKPLLGTIDRLFPARDGRELLEIVRHGALAWRAGEGKDARVRVALAPVIPERCSDEFLIGCRELSAELGLPIQMHFVETRVQAAERKRRNNTTTAAYLESLGLLSPNTTLAHAVWVSDADIEILARTGATVVHNPASNLKLGSGVMPMRRMLERGVALAVATDGSASSDNQNIFEAIRLAAYLHRPFEPDYEHWPRAARVLEMAWEGGARALGLAGEAGRIEPGYFADLALLDLDTETLTPLNDPVNQLVMCETGRAVRMVIVDGRVVLENGLPCLVDDVAIRAEARDIAKRLLVANRDRMEAMSAIEPHLRAAWLEVNKRYGAHA
jgi:cytosine/adenosine deaminase-related metal-dependent hydrolase